MADIITKDSEEFKELTGWIKRTGKIWRLLRHGYVRRLQTNII